MIDLRLILKLDAVVTGVNGIAYLALAGPLEDLLGVAPELTRPIGAFLVLFAAAVWFVATRPVVRRSAGRLRGAAFLRTLGIELSSAARGGCERGRSG